MKISRLSSLVTFFKTSKILFQRNFQENPEKCLRQTLFMNKLFDNKNYGSEKENDARDGNDGEEKKKHKNVLISCFMQNSRIIF